MKTNFLLFALSFLFINSYFGQDPCSKGTIIINGQNVNAVLNNENYGYNLPIWLNANSTVAAGNRVQFISIIEFNEQAQPNGGHSLIYNQVLTVGTAPQTVPPNKVWKIEAVVKLEDPFTSGIAASANSPICFDDNLNLTSSVSGVTYAWTGPNGFTSPNQNPTINNVNHTNAGTYYLTATHNGCTYTDSVNVVVNSLPASTFTNTFAIENYASIFTPTVSGANYSWNFASGNPSSGTAENPQVTWTTTGSYNVDLTVTDANGCSSTTTNSVTVSNCLSGQSQSNFSWNAPVYKGYATTFSPALSGETYSWIFDQGSPATNTTENPSVTWANPGTYNVTLTVNTSTGCYTEIQTVTVLGCQTNQPESDFSWNNPFLNKNVSFTPDDGTATAYTWTFDQATPNSSSVQSPNNIVWTNTGTYDVTLEASFPNTCYTTTQQITITDCQINQPDGDFSWNNPTGANFPTLFTPDNGTANNYEWTFDQATPSSSSVQSPNNIVWSNIGNYDVTLEAFFANVCYRTTKQVNVVLWTCGMPITDGRDGNTYNTVLIGSQCWMAENLNYTPQSPAPTNSWYYNNDNNNCTTYGRLYDWSTAMAGANSSNSNPSGVQGVCPTGWHLPSDVEWCELENTVEPGTDASCSNTGYRGTNTGTHLKDDISWNGNNSSGFSALPSGNKQPGGSFMHQGSRGTWWSSTDDDTTTAVSRDLDVGGAQGVNRYIVTKAFGISVRCVMD